LIKFIANTFDYCENYWESKQNSRNLSYILVIVFLLTIIIGGLNNFNLLPKFFLIADVKFTDSIMFSFNFLLFFEMIGLVFAIPQSISNSIAKQFQIMSLIFLRTSFEELSHISIDVPFVKQFEIITEMAVDAVASLIIFFLIYLFYKMQKHRKINDETELLKFNQLKKVIAVAVLFCLLFYVFVDVSNFLETGLYKPSYHLFFLILIFADMLLMLAAFRYVIEYANIFRYSSFVLITIFIRIALMAPIYYNVIIGIATVLFGIGVTYTHNLFFYKKQNTIKY